MTINASCFITVYLINTVHTPGIVPSTKDSHVHILPYIISFMIAILLGPLVSPHLRPFIKHKLQHRYAECVYLGPSP